MLNGHSIDASPVPERRPRRLPGSTTDRAALRDGRGGAADALAFDAREALRILRRRWRLIAGVIVAAMILVATALMNTVPRYTADLSILLESRVGPVFDMQAAVSGAPQDEAAILSEVDVIRSRVLAQRAIDKLQLDQDPEFNPALRSPSPFDRASQALSGMISAALSSVWKGARPAPTEVARNPESEALLQQQAVVREFLAHLSAQPAPRTRAIVVTFTATDPEKAARILDTVGELYLLSSLEDRLQNAHRASAWLAEHLAKLRERVALAERNVEDYRREHGLYEGERVSLMTEQLSTQSSRLTDVSLERGSAEAELAQARRLLASPAQLDTAVQVLQSDLIRRFREQELDLERKEAELGEELGRRHPQMIQLAAEKQRLREKVRGEVLKIVGGLENQVQSARAREAALERELQAVKQSMNRANEATVGLNMLIREAEASRLLLQRFSGTFAETSAQEDVNSQSPKARIISPALVPDAPSAPRIGLTLVVSLLAATVLGVVLAFALDLSDAGFRSAEQVEELTDLPAVALVPKLGSRYARSADPSLLTLRQPESAFAEAVRATGLWLDLAAPQSAAKVVLLTSADAEEGKSTLALSLVRQQAAAGRRTLLLDADFRRSEIAHRTSLARSPGMAELLRGEATAEQVVQSDPHSPASLIVAGRATPDGADLLRQRLAAVLEQFSRRYDLLVIDSPPILALSDAGYLATLADVTLLTVAWGRTRRRAVGYALRQVEKFGGCVHGVVLTMVDVRRHARYGYGDAGVYYGKALRYYAR